MAALASAGCSIQGSAEEGSLQLLVDSIADILVLLGGGVHLHGDIRQLGLFYFILLGSGSVQAR